MKRILATLCLTALLVSSGVCWAADFQKAIERGDCATALKEWTPLAEQGDAFAQHNLGVMYGNGQGVPQDYVRAHMWSNLSASQGSEGAAKVRDIVAERMTPFQIEQAQKLSQECAAKNYKGC
jgi:uncharacterized protein